MIKAHRNSQKLKHHVQELYESTAGPLCMYCGFKFSVFMGFLSVLTAGSLSFVHYFGLFSFCLFVLPYSDALAFLNDILFYY